VALRLEQLPHTSYHINMAEEEVVDFNSLPENVKRLIEVTYRSGYVRPQVTTRIGDMRFVAVGNRVLSGKWITFPDFLTDYCKTVLDVTWGAGELTKPEGQAHPIIEWYRRWAEFSASKQPSADGTFYAVSSGPVAAWFHLAYDLYVLQHHASLQTRLVERLRNKDQFQGARYELTIAATFIRAGFRLLHEDETDRNTRHPEFRAIHTSTREAIAVEVKSRHRPGVLGRAGEIENASEVRAGIGRLLQDAIDKAVEFPYVVCIDLNLPPFESGTVFEQPQIRELMETVIQKEKQYPREAFPITVLVATNFPHYYVANDTDDPRKDFIVSPSTFPKHPIRTAGFVDTLFKSLNEYPYIPNYFLDNG
jgi:hypothetical protein